MSRGARLLRGLASALAFLAVAGTAFLIAFGVGRWIDAGTRDRLVEARRRKEASTTLRELVSAAERSAPEFRAEIEELGEEYLTLEKILPPRADVEGLLAELVARGAELGLTVEEQRVGETLERERYRATPLEVELRGPLGAIAELIARLERRVPLVVPSELVVSWPPERELPAVNLTLELPWLADSEPTAR